MPSPSDIPDPTFPRVQFNGMRTPFHIEVGFPNRLAEASGAVDSICNFGEIITWLDGATTKTGIRGGGIEAGTIWEMPPYPINLALPGRSIIWIRVPLIVNLTPLGDASMSGIASSTAPSWESLAYDSSTSDPVTFGDKLVPAIFPAGDGAGVAIARVGILTVVAGSASLEASGCGDIIVTHCPGNLSHRRGSVDTSSSSA